MKNIIVAHFLKTGEMYRNIDKIEMEFSLEKKVMGALDENKMKAVYHFDLEDGALIFDKVLGRDAEGYFYNDENGNLEARKEELKKVIAGVLINEYKNQVGA